MKHEKVIQIIRRELDYKGPLELITPLKSLPMDSLEFVEMVQCVCAEVGQIPHDSLEFILGQESTVGDLVRAIK